MPSPKIEWTDELRARVKELWQDGKSSREIAEELGQGMTKNMVLGQLYSMGAMRSGKATNGASPRLLTSRKPTHPRREKAPVFHVSEVWELEDETRRRKFAQKAAKGARAQLLAIMAQG